MNVYLIRYASTDQGTQGLLWMTGFSCRTIELPWRDNVTNKSCIPAGEYGMEMVRARRAFSGIWDLYWVRGVPDRSGILIHIGNWAGDVEAGYISNSWGCILPGLKSGALGKPRQKAVLGSRHALARLHAAMHGRGATLKIQEVF